MSDAAEWRPKLYRGKWYAVRRHEGNTQRIALRVSTLELARQRIADLKIGLAAKPETIADHLDRYLDERKGNSGSASRKAHAKPIVAFFGHYRPEQVSKKLCREYIERRRKDTTAKAGTPVGDGTIRREMGQLRAALRSRDEGMPNVFELPPPPPPRDRHLTKAQFRKLLDAAERSPHIRGFMVLAVTTAARKSALLELRWSMVDFERKLINLGRGSSNKGRAILPMNNTAGDILAELRSIAVSDFVIEYGGKGIRDVRKGVENAARRAKLSWATPHVFRHTAAVWMAEAGVPMQEISQYLGHSSTKVTEAVYARFSPDYQRKAASSLELD